MGTPAPLTSPDTPPRLPLPRALRRLTDRRTAYIRIRDAFVELICSKEGTALSLTVVSEYAEPLGATRIFDFDAVDDMMEHLRATWAELDRSERAAVQGTLRNLRGRF